MVKHRKGGRTTPKKQPHVASVEEARDAIAEDLAAREHARLKAAHEATMAKAQTLNDRALRNPEFCESLGLPARLPEEAIVILRHTMALAEHGQDQPKISTAYRKYGLDRMVIDTARRPGGQ